MDFSQFKNWFGVVVAGIVEIPTILHIIPTTENIVDKILIFLGGLALLGVLAFIAYSSNNQHKGIIGIKKLSSNVATLTEAIERIDEEIMNTVDPTTRDAYRHIREMLSDQRQFLLDEINDTGN